MKGRKLRIKWEEDEAFLRDLYRKEENAQVQKRIQALWLVRRGYRLSQVAWLMGVHLRTINRWLSWYRSGGLKELMARRRGNPKGRRPFLTEQQIAKLKDELAKGTITGPKEAIAWVRENFGVNYSYWGMHSLLRREGLSGRGKSNKERVKIGVSVEVEGSINVEQA